MEPGKRFGYYARLSRGDKAIYRKSDAITAVPLPDAEALYPLVSALAAALETGKRHAVGRAARALCEALFAELGVLAIRVRVREVRPSHDGGELHGLYTFGQDGKAPEIEVWMRTAAHRRTVKFPTFLRTLMHEVAHHLDLTLFELGNSFHTAGFFRRESSLARQLLPAVQRAPRPEETPEDDRPAPPPKPAREPKPARKPKPARPPKSVRPPRPVQLSLFDDA